MGPRLAAAVALENPAPPTLQAGCDRDETIKRLALSQHPGLLGRRGIVRAGLRRHTREQDLVGIEGALRNIDRIVEATIGIQVPPSAGPTGPEGEGTSRLADVEHG